MGLNLRPRLFSYAFRCVRAFPVLGWGGTEIWQRFQSLDGVLPSQSPHDSDLMVLAGEIPDRWQDRLRALLETFALPRAVLWLAPPWTRQPPAGLPIGRTLPADRLEGVDLPLLASTLLAQRTRANQPLLPNRPTHPSAGGGADHSDWRGKAPYGRPLARPAEDVDHLALDDVPVLLGPHFPPLPSGLQLALWLQGDRIRACESVHNAFPMTPLERDGSRAGPGNHAAFEALHRRPVAVAALERARVHSHLSWMADFLVLLDQPALAERFRALRHHVDPAALAALGRAARPLLQPLLRGRGVIPAEAAAAANLVGPVARASGLRVDSRAEDPAYLRLDFRACFAAGGDLWARWEVRLAEALESMRLIQAASDQRTVSAEAPR